MTHMGGVVALSPERRRRARGVSPPWTYHGSLSATRSAPSSSQPAAAAGEVAVADERVVREVAPRREGPLERLAVAVGPRDRSRASRKPRITVHAVQQVAKEMCVEPAMGTVLRIGERPSGAAIGTRRAPP